MRRFFVAAALALTLASCTQTENYVAITGYAQGGKYMVKVNLRQADGSPVEMEPEQIKHGIDSIVTAIDNSLSGYNPNSLLSRFNRGETIVPDDIFLDIYAISYGFYQLTEGAFDVSAGPLFDIWGFGFKTDSLPSQQKVDSVMALCGMDRLLSDMRPVLAPDGSLSPADLLRPGAGSALPQLNYNAIAQGYSSDLVASYLTSLGIHDMLVDIGGEIFCDGLNPSGRPWTVGVDKPVDGNNTPGAMIEGTLDSKGRPCGIVTSGNYRKYYVADGRKYAHTVDPRSGFPVSHNLLSATIIAPDGATADALATYCMVIGLEKARDFILSRPDLEGYFIYDLSAPGENTLVSETDSLGIWYSGDGLENPDN